MARVGEEFPLECPACGGDIQLIAFGPQMDHIARNVERHQKDVFIDDDEGDRLVRELLGIRMRTCLPNVAAAKMHHDLFERDSAVLPQPGIFLGLPFEPHAKVCLLGTHSARPGAPRLPDGLEFGGQPLQAPAACRSSLAASIRWTTQPPPLHS
jgi:hypothetical protein